MLAEDGKKMSKSLKNYPAPDAILQNYGSDALRLYLINSPVVRAESVRFKESGVKEVVSRVLLPLWNSYRFFSEQAVLYKKSHDKEFIAEFPFAADKLTNVMDKWILADLQSLLKFMDQEMEGKQIIKFKHCRNSSDITIGYRLYTVVPRLLNVIDNLTNWYIRFNRKRLKGVAGLGVEDTLSAMNTLFQVLFTIVRALAPFTPFITEHIYGLLKPHLGDAIKQFEDPRSVHFIPFPTVQESLFDEVIERKVGFMTKVIELGRIARERCSISLKTPLLQLVVIADPHILSDVESLQSYIEEELNVRNVILTSDEGKYNIQLEAKVDWPTLGKKLKKDVQKVKKGLPNLTQDQLKEYLREKTISIDGIALEENDLTLVRVIGKHTIQQQQQQSSSTDSTTTPVPKWEPSFSEDVLILLDTAPHPELLDEGIARELINRVQRLRKKSGLVPTDDISMQYAIISNPDGVNVEKVVAANESMFLNALRGKLQEEEEKKEEEKGQTIAEEESGIGNLVLKFRLAKI